MTGRGDRPAHPASRHDIAHLLAPLTGVVVALAGTLVPWSESAKADVILHAFAWSYADVAAKADAIAAAGYKAVLLSPPLKSDKTSGCPWWRRYQPQDFRIIDNCDGNKESFQAAIAALQAITSPSTRP